MNNVSRQGESTMIVQRAFTSFLFYLKTKVHFFGRKFGWAWMRFGMEEIAFQIKPNS